MSARATSLGFAVAAVLALPAVAAADSSDDEKATDCPAAIQGVKITVTRSPRGAVLDFTNPAKANLSDLRQLLREAAATLEYHSKLAALHPELIGKNDDVLPPVDVTVKETEKGARLTIQAEDPGDATKVRTHVHHLESAWHADACVNGDLQGTVAHAQSS